MAAAVIELNSLPDPVRPTTQNQNLLPRCRRRLILFVVAAIEIRSVALELARASIHHLVDRQYIQLLPQRANRGSSLRTRQPPTGREPLIRDAHPFGRAQLLRSHLRYRHSTNRFDLIGN